MTLRGTLERYGSCTGKVKDQIERELALIGRLGFSGYFLVVWDICRYARDRGILVQGRGSAANSAVCYALRITAVDPIGRQLLFERFLSEGRSDWPDIDLDLPSGDAREDVIQEIYRRYGRHGAAMTANVISMRGKSTMREVGKAFGLPDDVLDRFSSLFHHGDYPQTMKVKEQLKNAGFAGDSRQLDLLLDTCRRVYALPRHLGQHSGGMVISAGGLSDFVPLENASMPGRSVLQWDKSDIEDMKMIKIDLLGLGMMAVLSEAIEICSRRGETLDYTRLPQDDARCFEMAQAADTIGVFQIESRAQMAMLPRLRPACFYDLVIQVALIRPGPIQGDAVNPYLERCAGRKPVRYLDPRTEPILKRTLGVVLFQEQILRMAMELGGFSAAEADELRRAIGFTRTSERLDRMKHKLREAFLRNGVTPEATESFITSLASFALYGFPESHAIGFAMIAYSSLWLKAHRPAVFLTALINNQPMGFYSVATLVQDAKRHGIRVLAPCVQVSEAATRVDNDSTVRLGLASIKGLRASAVEEMLRARNARPFVSMADFLKRTNFSAKERRALAGAGALNALAEHRRAALWQVESQDAADELFRLAVAEEQTLAPAPLEPMTLLERVRADFAHLEMTTGAHPMKLLRSQLNDVWPAAELKQCGNGQRVTIAGAVTCRQRPGTASGVVFVTLEDETGNANAIVWPAVFERYRLIINLEPALVITGKLQHESGVIHVIADVVEPLPALTVPVHSSHDYR
jgi:error-prone DNA polymerase